MRTTRCRPARRAARRQPCSWGWWAWAGWASGMVRRLMRAGHECVVYDVSADSVRALAAEGATGTGSMKEFVDALAEPKTAWLMVPAAFTGETVEQLAELMGEGDIIVDGGNSYYRDDVDTAARLAERGIRYVDCGTSGGVFGLERGYCLMVGGPDDAVAHLAPVFEALAPGFDAAPRTPGFTGETTHGRARLAALRSQRRRALRQDGAQRDRVRPDGRVRRGARDPAPRRRRQGGAHERRRDHAAARPAVLPVRPGHPRGRRGVAARQRRRVVAAGPDVEGAARRPRAWPASVGACPTPARAAGPCWPPSTRACPRSRSRPRCSSGSPRGATPSTPTSCSRRCARSSAATPSRPPAAGGADRAGDGRGRRAVPDRQDAGVGRAARAPGSAGRDDAARAVRRRPRPRRDDDGDRGRPVPGLQQAHRDRRDGTAAGRARRGGRAARADRRDVPRRAHQHDRGPRGAARRAAHAARRHARRRRPGRGRRRARGAGPDGRVRRPGAQRFLDRPHRPAHPHGRQHRHRRLRPRPGHGVPGAAGVLRPGAGVPVRLERRPHRHGRGAARPGPGDDAVHRLLEDVLDAGDPGQRDRGTQLAAGGSRARRGGRRRRRRAALRRGVDARRPGVRVRHRPGQHVRLLGLGRRPVLLRLRHRALAHGRDRARAVRRDAGRLPRGRRAPAHRTVRGATCRC